MVPDIYQIKYFLEVAQTLNFSKAAEEFHISRQALTKTIRKMEQMLGGELFYISGKSLTLTDLGKALEENAKPLMQAYRSFEDNMAQYQTNRHQVLSIALAHGTLLSLGENILNDFHALYPNILLSTEETHSDEVVSLVRDQGAEIGLIGSVPDYLKEFDIQPLCITGMNLQFSANHPLAAKAELHPLDLKGIPIVGSGHRNHQHRFFTDGCRKYGVEPNFIQNTSHVQLMRPTALSQNALTFSFPESVVPVPEGVAVRPLRFPGSEKLGTYSIVRRNARLSYGAQAFLDFLCARCKNEML
jgi:DNA-binding transcriptional LysR family regulator